MDAVQHKEDEDQDDPPTRWIHLVKSLERTPSCSDEVAEAGLILGRSLTENDLLDHVRHYPFPKDRRIDTSLIPAGIYLPRDAKVTEKRHTRYRASL